MGNTKILDKQELSKLYLEKQMPMHQIAKELNCSIGKVHKYIHFYNVPTREHKEVFSFKGHKLSVERRIEISKLHKGKKVSDKTRKKMSEAQLGKRINNEWNGHKKKSKSGYIRVYKPEHPRASVDGYVPEHHLVMEKYLGRYLQRNEIVHHINGKKDDNQISNLMIFTSIADHIRFHANLKKYKGCI